MEKVLKSPGAVQRLTDRSETVGFFFNFLHFHMGLSALPCLGLVSYFFSRLSGGAQQVSGTRTGWYASFHPVRQSIADRKDVVRGSQAREAALQDPGPNFLCDDPAVRDQTSMAVTSETRGSLGKPSVSISTATKQRW